MNRPTQTPIRWSERSFPGFSTADLRRFKAYYRQKSGLSQAGARRVGWTHSRSQKVRFEIFRSLAPLAGRKILDVGCGLGDFALYLRAQGLSLSYHGVDLFPAYIREASRSVPWGRFEVRHLLDRPFRAKAFDYGFLSGVFNIKIRDNRAYVAALTKAVLKSCARGVAFNLLHSGSGLKDPRRFTVDPGEMRAFGLGLPGVRRVRVLDHYLPNDLTVFLDKKAAP